MFAAGSELKRHCEQGVAVEDDPDSSWIVAGENESVESFLTRYPPSFMDKAWISAQHDGMTQLIEEHYASTTDAEEAYGRDNMDAIKAAWDEAPTKTLETLTATLKQHKYGCGKWMLFVPSSEVDAVWRKVVTNLWDGKLGHTAKVSGNTPECNGSHVINVYVDPFWEVAEVERVLKALREECGVNDAIKYKADGVTQLGLSKGNEHGIPPSFYAAARNATNLSVQRASGGRDGKDREWGRSGEGGEGRSERGGGRAGGGGGADKSSDKSSDKWTSSSRGGGAGGNSWVRREAPKQSNTTKASNAAPASGLKDHKAPKKVSAFAALAGVEGDDADAILAKKAAKKEKKRLAKAAASAEAKANVEVHFASIQSKLATADWGDMEDDEDEEVGGAAEESDVSSVSSDELTESEEEEEDDDDAANPDISDAQPSPSAPALAVEVKPKEKTKEELEVEALMASLDSPSDAGGGKEGGGGGGEGGLSKAAQKRAKKKAAAAGGAGGAEEGAKEEAAKEEPPASPGTDDAGEGGVKSAADIKKMMAAKAAAAKKDKGGAGGAAAEAAKEAKARAAADGGKKKKGPKHWESGGKNRGEKARGSDNKYQGE